MEETVHKKPSPSPPSRIGGLGPGVPGAIIPNAGATPLGEKPSSGGRGMGAGRTMSFSDLRLARAHGEAPGGLARVPRAGRLPPKRVPRLGGRPP
jgi:hypothetical protein